MKSIEKSFQRCITFNPRLMITKGTLRQREGENKCFETLNILTTCNNFKYIFLKYSDH